MDKDFKIRIVTDTDSTGAQRAASDLADVARSTEKSAVAAETHAKHSREMHRIFSELNRIVPGLGEALHAAFRPELIGILGAVVAIQKLVELFTTLRKNAEEASKAQATFLFEQKRAAEEFKAALVGSHDALKEKFDQEKTVLESVLALRRAILGEGFTGTMGAEARLAQLGGQRQELERKGFALEDTLSEIGGLDKGKIAAARTILDTSTEKDPAAIEAAAKTASAGREKWITAWSSVYADGDRARGEAAFAASKGGRAIDTFAALQLVQKWDATQKALAQNTAAREGIDTEIAQRKAVLPIDRQRETIGAAEKLFGVSDVAGLVPKVYPNMGAQQMQSVIYHLTNQTDFTAKLMIQFVSYLESSMPRFRQELQDVKRRLDSLK